MQRSHMPERGRFAFHRTNPHTLSWHRALLTYSGQPYVTTFFAVVGSTTLHDDFGTLKASQSLKFQMLCDDDRDKMRTLYSSKTQPSYGPPHLISLIITKLMSFAVDRQRENYLGRLCHVHEIPQRWDEELRRTWTVPRCHGEN